MVRKFESIDEWWERNGLDPDLLSEKRSQLAVKRRKLKESRIKKINDLFGARL